jgi:hypothetical protein
VRRSLPALFSDHHSFFYQMRPNLPNGNVKVARESQKASDQDKM